MTSVPKIPLNKRAHLRPAFTLFEMVITMVIIAAVMGSAVFLLTQGGSNTLSKLSIETEVLAKKTLRTAKEQQRAYFVIARHDAIWAESAIQSLELDNVTPSDEIGIITIPSDVTISYRIEGNDNWFALKKGNPPLVWAFSQAGLCEAVSLRFENDRGVTEETFHPLTASSLRDED